MASETEELTNQLREVVDSLKSVSQYSKDLAGAVGAANRPMQQMSDYAAAIGKQMESISKAFKETNESMAAMSTDMSDLVGKISQVNQGGQETNKQLSDEERAVMQAKKEYIEMQKVKQAIAIQEREQWAKTTKDREAEKNAIDAMASEWDKAKKAVHDYQVDLAKTSPNLASGMSTGSQLLTGAKDLQGGLSAVTGSLNSLLPTAGIGGLLGMIMYGKMKEAEFTAIGQTAAQQFDQIGGYTDGFAARLGSVSRILSVAGMAAKEDLAHVAASFASTGVSAKEAQESIKGFSSIVGNDLMVATLAADKALELQAGTMAKLSGILAKDFNTSAKEAFINLTNIGSAAKEAGLNAATFMQQSMDAASSLRLLNANSEAVMHTQLSMAKAMNDSGFGTAFSGSYAAAGTANVAGAVGGMQEGLAAIIGQRMGYGSGIDALYAMKSPRGREGGEQIDMTSVMKEMKSIVDTMGGNRAEKAFAMTKVFGVDYSGADTILDAMNEVSSSGELSAKSIKDLHSAFASEADKTSTMIRIMEGIKDAVAGTMVGMLKMVVEGIKLIYNATMYSANAIQSLLTIGNKDLANAYDEKAGVYFEQMQGNIRGMGEGWEGVAKGVGRVTGYAKEFGNNMVGPGMTPGQEATIKDANERIEREKKTKGVVDIGDAASLTANAMTGGLYGIGRDAYAATKMLAGLAGSDETAAVTNGRRLKVTVTEVGTDGGRKEYSGTDRKR